MKRYSRYYSPLRYPGGKVCVYPFVSNLIYENGLLGAKYVEPFAGGAGLALRLLFDEYVREIYINDYDYAIYAFWKVIKADTEEFCEWLNGIEVSIDNWRYYKEVQNNLSGYDIKEIARSTFFLNRTNVSGILKGGMIGGYEQKGKYKIDARFNKEDLIKRIKRIGEFADRIHVSNEDAIDFIHKVDDGNKSTLIYLDPPYVQKGSNLYMNFYEKSNHETLAKLVAGIKSKWFVSYDKHDLIINLYSKYRKITHSLSQSASNRLGDEIIIFSNKLSFKDSLKSLKNPEEIDVKLQV